MFIEFIPLSLAYNLHARTIQIGMCIPDMHVCIGTRLVHTRELCTVGLMSSILRAHAGLHACEMKNVLCRALAACVFCQV